MNNLQIFKNPEFGQIRTVQLNNETYFVGKDVADILGYQNGSRDINRHVEKEDRQNYQNGTFESPRGMTVINESGLYALIFGSKLESAKRFKHWVTSEVLPAIRKTGSYSATAPQGKELLALAVLEAQKTIEDQSRQIEIMKPKADYVDYILSAPGTVTVSQIAADYNISAQKLNKILHEEKLQRFVNKQWILYKKHMGKGYAKSETFGFHHRNGMPDTKMSTRWTQKGRLKINEILNSRGIYANMDIIKNQGA